ncbi:OmpH family outer membrane protein [Flavobacterium sp. D11R37]|uniref:OmpH family outer membrane protein n=1 Tax=Flavobacterium coralii TaxID=2838017 RepID=UPI001CA74DEF|nr:OmpH family outer membrane protein [Flavobacterium coralii]MBY8963362.1 OmpH family outer membrane protein [Flavobacterium coralii]
MKKSLLILGLAITLFSCNKEQTASGGMKTAYIDTVKLMEEYEELKDLESKGKVKSDEMARELEGEAQKLRLDAASFQNEAQSKGRQWAELKMQELQKRERELGIKQETMMRQLQDEFGVKRDTIIAQMKKHIKEYGKKEGYDYIYGTGDAASVLYAKEQYDITADILKQLNEKYKGDADTTEEPAEKEKDTTATAK